MGEQLHLSLDREKNKRDVALDLLARTRKELIGAAKQWARYLVRANGRVTSPEVLKSLRDNGWGDHLDQVDRRFMGVVFRKGWRRIGWTNSGSQARPGPIWEMCDG